MIHTIQAIYEEGVLKPLRKITLPEHKKVILRILDVEDISLNRISEVAYKSESYKFLKRKSENIYSLTDGKRT